MKHSVKSNSTYPKQKKLIDRFEYINAKGSLAFGTFNVLHKSSQIHATSAGVKYDEIDFIYIVEMKEQKKVKFNGL